MAMNDKDLKKVLIGDHLVLEYTEKGEKRYVGVGVLDFDSNNNLEITGGHIFNREGKPVKLQGHLEGAKLLPLTDETIKFIKNYK